jgi:integral membrane sensor domain MASE1
MGVLFITPLLLAARTARLPRGSPVWRWAEALLLLGGTAAVAVLATRTSINLLFLVVPFLIWAAFRFQLLGAAPCALIASLIAIHAGAIGSGPFVGHNLLAKMVILQAFNGTVALTALLLSAIVAERDQTLRALQDACDDLAEALSRLVPDQPPPVRPTAPTPTGDTGDTGARRRDGTENRTHD